MTALPYSTNTPGAGVYHADTTGNILVALWGAGGGGAGGVGLSRGGAGGGGGALSLFVVPVVAGVDYPFYIGHKGTGGAWPDGGGTDGEDSYWGSSSVTARYRAQGGKRAPGGGLTPGAGGGDSGSAGDTIQPGDDGTAAVNSDFSGKPGGKGGGTAGGAGGTATGGGGQGAGGAGAAPGGGGSGGGQTSAGAGGDGADGGISIVVAPATKYGYYHLGISDDGVYDGAGTYNWTAPATGTACVELYGSGGGGAGGVPLSLQGRSGGGGGAYAKKIVPVYKGVVYRRVVPAGGAGSAVSTSAAGSPGADATFTLAPMNVSTKQVSAGVGILKFTTPHGYNPGDSIIVAGVDSTFNGTKTVSSISSDRKILRYAVSGGNVSETAATGTVSPNFNIVLAKGGAGATNGSGAGSGGAGGSASSSIGDVTNRGEDGEDCWGAQVGGVTGTNGGTAGLPNGGIGGWGGKRNEDDNTVVPGGNGTVPGGGGGGGAGQNSGNGGNGAPGGAIISYILSLGTIVEDHIARPILRIVWKDNGGVTREITDTELAHSGITVDQRALTFDPAAGTRKIPSWVPAGYEDRFDLATGRFNWDVGAPNTKAALAAKNFHWLHCGDSVSDGSTALNRSNPLDYTINYATAYPRTTRSLLATALGTVVQGTGLVRPANVATADPMWARGSWTDKTHYLESNNTSHVATFTPNIAGTAIRVTTCGTGALNVTIDGVFAGTVPGGANDLAVQSVAFTGLSNAIHTVQCSPAAAATTRLLGADSYTPGNGIKVHNVSQGGSRAALGSASSPQQNVWGDTGAAPPTNMTNLYRQVAGFERRVDAAVLALGGNDAFQLISAANIKSAFDTVGQALDHASTDIILYPDTHNVAQISALYDLCITRGWAMIDFFYLSRQLRSIFGLDYNGDTYGHLKSPEGAAWMAALFKVGLYGS